jgi:hypothetical protein
MNLLNKKKKKCKRPTTEKIKYQLGGQVSDEQAEEILHQMEQFCELLLEQLDYGQKI